ncbi:hypothetical protein [Lacrimispora xylanolytica]|uniref:Lipoprotein n=1 Tax=Lacrimispora xylanolytica TaxID=29375 RepID=A0ABY7AE51_9FIRM|nr:hypothetical protein [Lacrimispora xylanolytica]WAJ24119.1 hypothetical protein OW255_00920 [Lacrimispora xylanolytica]
MKKTLIAALVLCAALVFTACGKKASQTQNTGTTAETKSTETTAQVSTEAPGNTGEFKILTGKVISVTDNMKGITIENGSAKTVLDLNDAAVETSYALDQGVEVSVVYKGEISGADAKNAKILLVLDAQENMKTLEATGTVADQAMSTFTIQTEDGKELSFMKNNAEGLDSDVLGTADDDSNGSKAKVKVTYVSVTYDAGSISNYPLKVEAAK